MSTAALLIFLGAALPFVMGTGHLLLTLFSEKFSPRDETLEARMRMDAMNLTRRTSMWNAWLGFNMSHSMAPMLFGLVYGYLALCAPEILFGSLYLKAVGLVFLAGILAVGLRFWFRVPNTGIAISLLLYLAGLAA